MKKLIMHPVFAGPLIIVGLALLIVYVLIPPPLGDWSWAYVRNELWKMPGGVGALLGAGLGLGAVAVAAILGFDNLIAAQKHQAKVDREAELDRIEWEQQCLAAGLAGELGSVITDCQVHIAWLGQIGEKMAEHAKDEKFRGKALRLDMVPTTECLFFRSSAGKIGLLGTALASDVTRAYEYLAYWRRHVETFGETYPEVFAEQAPRYAEIIEQRILILENLVLRLEAVERGEGDPGKGPAAAVGEAGD